MHARLVRPILAALGALAALVGLGWALGHVMPPPLSGYLAFAIVGVAAIQLYKSQPGQRAARLFRAYLRARARGAGEDAARQQILDRESAAGATRAAWVGSTEAERLMAGVNALLARRGVTVEPDALAAAYARERDRFPIPGWALLPPAFVRAVRTRLDEGERSDLDALMERYALFHQRFFARPSLLAADPEASAIDFARLLHSMGNRLAKEHPADAELAYRLSLRIRADDNLAHAGLALLLAGTGRGAEASAEARTALQVLDRYARRAQQDEAPTTEDISPFRSPAQLREALARVLGPGSGEAAG